MSRIHRALRRAATLSAMTAAGVAAVGLVTQGAASADAFVKLPNGQQQGDGLTLTRTNESAQISPSLAANGIGRTAWVSADITLVAKGLTASPTKPNNGPSGETALPGSNGASNDGSAATLSTGYIVGCQVAIGSLTLGGGGALSGLGGVTPSLNLTGSLAVPITPGSVTFAPIGYKDISKSGTYHYGYSRFQLAIQGCGGYAQARAYTVVETTGDDHQKVTLYGKPFSIG
ncbi:MspA family porin [Williamsia sterculiae]|uniref:MspA protein n=1 Tax=Williamsia sterculiae TaxID=1344003 RepID=A0A1N7DI92_9NOCA|nr:MspA family porin [Williamsia sterculiae]SIR75542.1 MspA protein [Williamsia sterculiae]